MSPARLLKLVKEGKCIVWLSGRHMPATFIASMQFWRVMHMLPQLKEYKPKGKR